jgi:hypothetical protein
MADKLRTRPYCTQWTFVELAWLADLFDVVYNSQGIAGTPKKLSFKAIVHLPGRLIPIPARET